MTDNRPSSLNQFITIADVETPRYNQEDSIFLRVQIGDVAPRKSDADPMDTDVHPKIDTNAGPGIDTNAGPGIDTISAHGIGTNADPSLNTNADPSLDTNADPSLDTNRDQTDMEHDQWLMEY